MPPPTVVFEGGPIGDSSDHSLGRRQSMRDQSRRKSPQSMRDQSTRSKATVSQASESAVRRPHLMLEDPIDGPWQRIRDEWKHEDSWFGLDDCGRLLDVPNTFGGNQTVQKWLIFLWMVATCLYLWSTAGGAWFLGNLDHWALLFSVLYQTLSLANAHFAPPQPEDSSEPANLYLRFFWIVFEIAAHLQLLVTLLFWMVTFPSNNSEITYGTFALHGLGLLAVWIDGMSLNRIPVRIKHYFVVLVVDTVYCLWTVVHAGAGLDNGTSSDDGNNNSNPDRSDAVYPALDWRNQTVQAVFLAVAILTVLAPLCFLAQYLFSLFSCPWTWNGSKSRRCIEFEMSRSATSRSQRKRFQPPSNCRTSETRSASSGLDLSVMDGSNKRSVPTANGRAGAASPVPPSKRLSIRAPRPASPTPRRPAAPTPRRASTASPASPTPRRPTAPTPRRPTSPTPRRASTASPTSPTPRRPTTPTPRRPTTPTPRRTSTAPSKPTPRSASTAPTPRRTSTAPTPRRPTTPAPARPSSPTKKSRAATPTPKSPTKKSAPKRASTANHATAKKRFPAQERRDSTNNNKKTPPSNNNNNNKKQTKKPIKTKTRIIKDIA